MFIKNIFYLEDNNYSNATFKDNQYYMLDYLTANIYSYDNNKKRIEAKRLNQKYTILTYNAKDDCFIMGQGSSKFNKLDNTFKETDKFIVKNCRQNINDIAYDKFNDKYLIVDDLNAYSVNSYGSFIKNELFTYDFYQKCCDSPKRTMPSNFKFTAIGTDGAFNYVAYCKNGSSFLSKLSKNGNLIETLFIGDNIRIKSILFNEKLLLLGTDNKKNYLYEIDFGTDSKHDPKIQMIIDNIISLIQNVAYNEAAIGNLVNSESEKVRKITEIGQTAEEIIGVNNSVIPIITEAAVMEAKQNSNLLLLLQSILELEKYLN